MDWHMLEAHYQKQIEIASICANLLNQLNSYRLFQTVLILT